MIESAEIVEERKLHLRIELADDYYTSDVSAHIEIRWYRNDDFNFHYQEEHEGSRWLCRWDRHPNVHNSREHFHLPSVASRTFAEDAQWPADHRDMCQLVHRSH